MENSEGKMIIQAIRELSVKVDQISGFNQQLTEKVDQNHTALSKRMDSMEEKMDYIQHKLIEHDQDIYTLKRKVR